MLGGHFSPEQSICAVTGGHQLSVNYLVRNCRQNLECCWANVCMRENALSEGKKCMLWIHTNLTLVLGNTSQNIALTLASTYLCLMILLIMTLATTFNLALQTLFCENFVLCIWTSIHRAFVNILFINLTNILFHLSHDFVISLFTFSFEELFII